jgi:hypothetical protein
VVHARRLSIVDLVGRRDPCVVAGRVHDPGALHGKRPEDVRLEIRFVSSSRHILDHEAGQRHAVAGIRGQLTRGAVTHQAARHEVRERRNIAGALEATARQLVEAGCVSQEVGDRDRRRIRGRHASAFQIRVDIRLERDLAALDQPHEGEGREDLRDRREWPHGVGGRRRAGLGVGHSIATGVHDPSIADDHESRPRRARLLEAGFDQRIDQCR